MRSSHKVQQRVNRSDGAGGVAAAVTAEIHILSKLQLKPQTEGRKGTLGVMNWTLWLCFLFLPQAANLIALNK